MTTVHPFSPDPLAHVTTRRRRTRPVSRRHKAIRAYSAPPAVAGTLVPATLAALSAPTVQLNAATLLPHVEALLAGPFGAPALALGCAVSAGIAATMRLNQRDPRAQIKQFLGAAGQAGLGAPLMLGALRMALGPAYTVNLLARGVVLGIATIMGTIAGRQAGHVVGSRLIPLTPPRGKNYSDVAWQQQRRDQADAARHSSRLGGLAAGAIVGIATWRAL